MNTKKIIFETGATSEAVNDLILFTDTTRELAELRDNIYKAWIEKGNPYGHEWTLTDSFGSLLEAACKRYAKEFPTSYKHVFIYRQKGKFEEQKEYCTIYANRFADWKLGHGYK